MGTEKLTDKQIKRAVVVACKAMKIAGEKDTRSDRSFDGDNFGINVNAEEEVKAHVAEEVKAHVAEKHYGDFMGLPVVKPKIHTVIEEITKMATFDSMKRLEKIVYEDDDSPF